MENDTKIYCQRCKKEKILDKFKMCENCRAYHRSFKNNQKLKGLCPQCGNKLIDNTFIYCVSCRTKDKVKRQIEKNNNICQNCGKPTLSNEFTTCEKCRIKHRIIDNKRNKQKQINNLCHQCGKNPREKDKSRCLDCLEERRKTWKKYYHRDDVLNKHKEIKLKVFSHYGLYCACCGATGLEFLAIDHIDGKGYKHRKQIRNNNIYKWLIKNNFPLGFQTLCHSCNFAKRNSTECPHKQIIDKMLTKIAKIGLVTY